MAYGLFQLILYKSSKYETASLVARSRLLTAKKTLNMDYNPAGTRVQCLKNTNSRAARWYGTELTCFRGHKIQNKECAETYRKVSLSEAANIPVWLDIKYRPIAVSSGNPHTAQRRHFCRFLYTYLLGYGSFLHELMSL
jgi:hypothetical protein